MVFNLFSFGGAPQRFKCAASKILGPTINISNSRLVDLFAVHSLTSVSSASFIVCTYQAPRRRHLAKLTLMHYENIAFRFGAHGRSQNIFPQYHCLIYVERPAAIARKYVCKQKGRGKRCSHIGLTLPIRPQFSNVGHT